MERLELTALAEALKRPRLELPHALPRDSEPPADLVERDGVAVAVQAVAELDYLLLPVRSSPTA